MEDIKFSIIIPVYNVELFLKQCLESVINQTYKNLEIILIDDGSTDSSGTICDNYKIADNRIIVIHKRNEGLGNARNTGIEIATGDYLFFLDSDDFIDINLFKICFSYLLRNKWDMISFDMYRFFDNRLMETHKFPKEKIYIGNDVYNFIKLSKYNTKNLRLSDSTHCRLYSMNLIKKTKFKFVSEREYISEDFYSHIYLMRYVDNLIVIPYKLYYYRVTSNSLTMSFRPDRIEKNLFQYEKSIVLLNKLKYPADISNEIAMQSIGNIISAFDMLINEKLPKNEKRSIFLQQISNHKLQKVIEKLVIDKEPLKRKILFSHWKSQKYNIVYLLFLARNKKLLSIK